MPTNLSWLEAQQLALSGVRVRRTNWQTYWLRYNTAIWSIEENLTNQHVVKANDFTTEEFLATDWTTEPYKPPDVCSRPPAANGPFIPPAVSLDGKLSSDLLEITITAHLGAGSYGAYRLFYFVNDQQIALTAVLASGSYSQTVAADPAWLSGDPIRLRLRVESILPLLPWQIEVSEQIQRADFGVLRYIWTVEGGTDLDSRTAFINLDPEANGYDVGWARSPHIHGPSGSYLKWGGDNTTSVGYEAVLIGFKAISTDYPWLTNVSLRLRGNWYGLRLNGNITLQLQTYFGGSMSNDGLDFVNTGGVLMNTINLTRNVYSHYAANVDGSGCGILSFNTGTKKAVIL